jgi:hypothetical protein
MFRVHKEQKEALAADAAKTYPRRVFDLVRAHFPEKCEELGEARSLGLVEQVIPRAASYGLFRERDVAMFAVLAFLYGAAFDERRWASEILNDMTITEPSARARALYDAAVRRSFEASLATRGGGPSDG